MKLSRRGLLAGVLGLPIVGLLGKGKPGATVTTLHPAPFVDELWRSEMLAQQLADTSTSYTPTSVTDPQRLILTNLKGTNVHVITLADLRTGYRGPT